MVVFKHPRTNETYIKRVVGLPGDKVEIRNGRIIINDKLAERSYINDLRYKEHKGGVVKVRSFGETLSNNASHQIYERSDQWHGDNFTPVTVPEGHLFVLGDNRDNSLDSRYLMRGVGFLPTSRLVGRADHLAFSTYQCRKTSDQKCLKRKWFSRLD